jgi:hypothetical protein
VRFTPARVCLVLPFLIATLDAIVASPCAAQTLVTSHEALRRELEVGDCITIVPAVGQPIRGRLLRLGNVDLDIRVTDRRIPQGRGPRDVTLALNAIQSLERPRDSARNGAAIGAGIGAAFVGSMFVHALVVDRNEFDEWATLYLGAGAIYIGIGALIGWAIDAASSKPHIRFDASPTKGTRVSVQPVRTPGRGIAVAVLLGR